MPEQLTLTTPVSQPSITDYTAMILTIDRTNTTVSVLLRSNNTTVPQISAVWGAMGSAKGGLQTSTGFSNANAPANFASVLAWVRALNKADLTSNSLDRRIYQQLIDDGAFVGSVTGTPA